ncbi:MAG: DUF3443 family protein [Terracidiphilus sp.]
MRKLSLAMTTAGLLFVVGCGSNSTNSSTGSGGTTTGSNTMAISVNGGPTANQMNGFIYENAAFASATICVPGSTSNCVTVDNLLVDTGSTGLRVLQSALTSLNLPTIDAANGSPAFDCVSFVDGSFLWGPVQQADVTLGGEVASSLPVHVISASNNVPSSCSNGSSLNENTQSSLGANGILGVGVEPTDCFYQGASVCDPGFGLSNPPAPAYYTCSGNPCIPAFITVAKQVANPVALFPVDNNGVIVELPAVSGSAATLSGSLVFGIGTQSNNRLPSSATIFQLTCDDFTTVFDNQTYGITNPATCVGPGSFIDSGSNGLFFPNATNIPACSSNTPAGDLSSFYCPSSTQSLSAKLEGAAGTSKSADFSVQNAETLFTSSGTESDAALSGLAGLNPSGVGFDWGLPFFYGINLYTSIDGQKTPSGAPASPWWAY